MSLTFNWCMGKLVTGAVNMLILITILATTGSIGATVVVGGFLTAFMEVTFES